MNKNLEAKESFIRDHHQRFTASTVRSYSISLRQFFSFCQKDIGKVVAADIRRWLSSMREKKLSDNTINLKLSAVKSFYNYCMEEDIVSNNPTITIISPRKSDSLPKYLNRKELVQLQELAKEDCRDRALVDALYATGLRISELLSVEVSDIQWEAKQIWVKGKGNKDRFVLLTHECAERLKQYINQKKVASPYLFSNSRGGPLSTSLIGLRFRKLSEKLCRKVTPHTLRHTFAAHLSERGMPYRYIQELLGHSNINSTRIYTRLHDDAQKKKYDQFQQ